MAGRGEQPRPHSIGRKVTRVPPRAEQGFLDNVLGQLSVTTSQSLHEPQQRRPVLDDKVTGQFLTRQPRRTHTYYNAGSAACTQSTPTRLEHNEGGHVP
jgi:hypothetical protein